MTQYNTTHLECLHRLHGIDGTRLAVPDLDALIIACCDQAVVVCCIGDLCECKCVCVDLDARLPTTQFKLNVFATEQLSPLYATHRVHRAVMAPQLPDETCGADVPDQHLCAWF